MKTDEIKEQIKQYDDDLIIKIKDCNNVELVKSWGDLENCNHKVRNIKAADLKKKLASGASNIMVRKGNSIFLIIKISKRGKYLIIKY